MCMVAVVKRPHPQHTQHTQACLIYIHQNTLLTDSPLTDEESMVAAGSKPTLMAEFTKLSATTNNEREHSNAEASTLRRADRVSINTLLLLLSDITFHMGAASFSLQQPSSSLSCVSDRKSVV